MTTRTRKLRRATDAPGPGAREGASCGRGCIERLGAGLLGVVMMLAIGCGGSGGSEGGDAGGGAQPNVETAPVDLPPGVTSALIGWEPSRGEVSSYLVFRSANGGSFDFSSVVVTPSTTITGVAGDEVRLIVVAVSSDGESSDPSPASAPIRFHPAPAPASPVAALDAPSGSGVTGAPASLEAAPVASPGLASRVDGDADAEGAGVDAEVEGGDTDGADASARRDALRAVIAAARPRLAQTGLSAEASLWLQALVDEHVGAGVALVATGDADDDERRELVWRDAAGQLFVTAGDDVDAALDPALTLVEALRLGPTERLRFLADLDGDAIGDWLIEDVAVGERWVLRGADGALLEGSERWLPAPDDGSGFLGLGDLDGDGRVELVAASGPGALTAFGPDRVLELSASSPPSEQGLRLLQVADVDGDGRDDLIARTAEDRLLLGLSREASDGGVAIVWTAGPAERCAGLELIATLDLDGDGAVELAWLRSGEQTLELWSARTGPRDTPTL